MHEIILVFILVVIFALLLCLANFCCGGGDDESDDISNDDVGDESDTTHEGGAHEGGNGNTHEGGNGNTHEGGTHDTPHSSLDMAIYNHASTLKTRDSIVGVHPLDADKYTADATGGGPVANKKWTDYASWSELQKNKLAINLYLRERARVLNDPNLDWSKVLEVMLPKLHSDREFIGVANLEPDGKTLYIDSYEASTTTKYDTSDGHIFAEIPAKLIEKYASRPGLFLFHTHIDEPNSSPLPSSADLSSSIIFAASAKFAGCALISKYGVMIYGLEWSAYKTLHQNKHWDLSINNLCHDIVVSHEAIRSWRPHSLDDYLGFFPRHQLFMVLYPSSEFVGDSKCLTFEWDPDDTIDHELISRHVNDIMRVSLLEKKRSKKLFQTQFPRYSRKIKSFKAQIPYQ